MARYYLDGYNIAHILADPTAADGGRSGVLRRLEEQRPQGRGRHQIVVVFDGRPGPGGVPEPADAAVIKIVFTGDRSADDWMKEAVEGSSRRKEITVVTNDRAVGYYARSLGARWVRVEEFFTAKAGRPDGGAGRKPAARKRLSPCQAQRIDAELSEIWLSSEPKAKKRKGGRS